MGLPPVHPGRGLPWRGVTDLIWPLHKHTEARPVSPYGLSLRSVSPYGGPSQKHTHKKAFNLVQPPGSLVFVVRSRF